MPPITTTSGKRVWHWTEKRVRVAKTLVNAGVGSQTIADVVGCKRLQVLKRFPSLAKAVGTGGAAPTQSRSFSDDEVNVAATLAAYGVGKSQIARLLRTSVPTLERECGAALELATVQMNAHAAGFLYQQMRAGSTQATIFWLKTRGGDAWRETQHISIEDKSGVLVTPGGTDPTKWMEMEEARTAANDPSARDAAALGMQKAAVSSFAKARSGGAAAPWDAAAGSDVGDLAVPTAFELTPVADLGMPDEAGIGDLAAAADEEEARKRQSAALDAQIAALLG